MRHGQTAFVALAVATLAPAASAQVESLDWIGANIGVFFPADSDLRNAMGDSWFSIGATGLSNNPYMNQRSAFDWQTFSKDNNGNKVFLASGTYGIYLPVGNNRGQFRPFAAVRAGVSYIDYAIGAGASRVGSKRIGFTGNAEVGVMLSDRVNLSARYDFFPSYDGFNFSGFSVSLKYGLFRF